MAASYQLPFGFGPLCQVLMSGPDTLCKMVAETFIELGRQEDK